jgi:hypothetical protein
VTKMKILVVGSGTAGLISAGILKRFLNCEIDVLSSSSIDIVGVGEGSTEHFKEFMVFLGIDQYDLIKECGATLKSGIMFEGWSEKKYFHNVSFPFNNKIAQYPNVYANQITSGNSITPEYFWENKIPLSFSGNSNYYVTNQYHFDTFKLNKFLKNFLTDMGIKFFDDEIIDVSLGNNGQIEKVISKKNDYCYDFYIDATGFKKILMKHLGSKWISFSDTLLVDSALTFTLEETEEYNTWTSAIAMDYGWMFNIPVLGRSGNGYIYSSDYIDEDCAKKEIEKKIQDKIIINKKINFSCGKINRAWVKNCVAVGLSAVFLEPMEASSIGTTIQQCFVLMHKISNYGQKNIDEYNKIFDDIVENSKDFIHLHYLTKKTSTKFWIDSSHTKKSNFLNESISMWKNKLPILEDFKNLSNYILFNSDNFIVVMSGLNLFNVEQIKKEYNGLSEEIKINAKNVLDKYNMEMKKEKFIGHKDFIKNIGGSS